MNTNEKITLLKNSMVVKTRTDKSTFTCFSDIAPKNLVDLFLENYKIQDLDYEIFSKAIDAIVENYDDETLDADALVEKIQDNGTEFASVYNAVRLSYLNIWNDDEIASVMKEFECGYISEACAYWYDDKVKEAIRLVTDNFLTK